MNARQTGRPPSRSYATLVGILGEETAQQFCHEFGGQKIWIPVRRRQQTTLSPVIQRCVDLIGEDKMQLLCLSTGGGYFVVPKKIATDCRILHQRMAQMHREGMKIDDIAVALNKSRRTIFRWLKQPHNTLGMTA